MFVYTVYIYIWNTLWLFNIDMENDPFIDGLPINSMVIFHGKLLNNQRLYISPLKKDRQALQTDDVSPITLGTKKVEPTHSIQQGRKY